MKNQSKIPVARLSLGAALALLVGAAQAQEVVKIGYSGPLSGGAALYGRDVLDGMKLAVNEINKNPVEIGGKKYKFEIEALDDKYNPSESAINAQRLVQQHKTPVVLISHSGGIYAAQTSNEAQKFLIIAYSGAPKITHTKNKLTFRIPPMFTDYIPAYVNYSVKTHGKNLAIAVGDHDYGKGWTEAVKPAWTAAGGKIVAENLMSYNRATDFYSGVSRVLASKPDVMLVGGASEPTALVIKQARELGYKGGFMVIDQAKLEDVAKVLGGYGPLEGVVGPFPIAELGRPGTSKFVQSYRTLHGGKDPNAEHALPYFGIHTVVQAMKLAGTTTDAVAIREKLDAAIKSLPDTANPYGYTGVDELGAGVLKPPVAVIRNGKPTEE